MKVHKHTFGELDQPGSIWAAVTDARGDHQMMMRFLATKNYACADECRKRRDTTLRAIRIIARGFMAECNRFDNAQKFKAATKAAKTCRVPGIPWTFQCGICPACLAAKSTAPKAEESVPADSKAEPRECAPVHPEKSLSTAGFQWFHRSSDPAHVISLCIGHSYLAGKGWEPGKGSLHGLCVATVCCSCNGMATIARMRNAPLMPCAPTPAALTQAVTSY